MNSTVDEMTKSTGRLSLFECNIDELQQLTSQYPFFAPAKFLLAQKMKEKKSFLFEEQIQKASIYFQNPVWLDHLLNDTQVDQNDTGVKKEEPPFAPQAEMEIPVTHEEVVDQIKTEQDDEMTAEQAAMEISATHEEVVDQIKTGQDDEMTEEQAGIEIPATHKEVVDQIKTEEDDEMTEDQEEGNSPPELSIELPKFKFEPIDPAKAELSFEPYHTIDYFASQGIKAKEEEKPKDQLSRQLKSFTEWIKAMKRLPASEIAASVSITEEKKVEKMAETSINDREVVTEAMAEVWEKQGNVAKASEIYQKLSLLNPGKSSYFAAKIEQLKNL